MNEKRLIIDIGNTAIKVAIFDNSKIYDFIGFFKMPKELPKLKEKLLEASKHECKQGMIFSVVPKHNKTISKLVKKIFGFEIKIFDWENYKLKNRDSRIKESIGADLLADIKEGQKLAKACMIADCGTITKLIVLDGESNFVGLSLFPGIEIMSKLAKNNTALLPDFEINNSAIDFGLNTIDSMKHGTIFGTVSYIKNSFESIEDKDKKLIITGGNSRLIKNQFEDAIIDPDFTLKGMNILFNEVNK